MREHDESQVGSENRSLEKDDLDVNKSGFDGPENSPTCRPVSPSGTFGTKDHFSPPRPPRLEFTSEEGSDSGAECNTVENPPLSFLPLMATGHDSDVNVT